MNNGPMKSPDDAAAEIRQLLSVYIQEHQELKTSAWFEQANAGLIAFNAAFPKGNSHNLDEIKAHVLNKLAPTFVTFLKWIVGLHGSSTLRTDLEKAANSWPKHQDYLVHAAEQKAAKAEADRLVLVKEKETIEAAKAKLIVEKEAAEAALLKEKSDAEADKLVLVKEKETIEAAKAALMKEKEAAEAAKQQLAEEKLKLAEDSEAARQMLLKRQETLEKQLAELTLQNQGSVPAEEVELLTKRVETLQLLNQKLLSNTAAARAAPLLPTPTSATVANPPLSYLGAATRAQTPNQSNVPERAANEASATGATSDAQTQKGRRRNKYNH